MDFWLSAIRLTPKMPTEMLDTTDLISVKVKTKGLLAWIVNESEVVIEVGKGTGLIDIFAIIGKRYGQDLQKLLLEPDGRLSNSVVVLLDNVQLPHHDLPKIKIERASVMTLIPLAAGG